MLGMETIEAVLKDETTHVAVIGAFSIEGPDNDRSDEEKSPGRTVSAPASEIRSKLRFSLGARRERRTYDGGEPFWTYTILTPAEVRRQKLDREMLRIVPAGQGPLKDYIADASTLESRIGAQVMGDLIDATERCMAFWHAAFAEQLTAAFFYSRSAKRASGAEHEDEAMHDFLLRRVVRERETNRRILDYLRASDEQMRHLPGIEKAPREAIREVLRTLEAPQPERLATELAADLKMLRQWLYAGDHEAERAPAHLRVLDGVGTGKLALYARDFVRVRQANPIPGHVEATLRQACALYRDAHDAVERIAHCEPLMAFATEWYLGTFLDEETADHEQIAQAVFDALYRDNRAARPSALPEPVRRAGAEAHDRAISARRSGLGDPAPGVEAVDAMLTNDAIVERRARAGHRRHPGRAEIERLARDKLLETVRARIPGGDRARAEVRSVADAARRAERAVGEIYDAACEETTPREELLSHVRPALTDLVELAGEFGTEMRRSWLEGKRTRGPKGADLCNELVVQIATVEAACKRRAIDAFLASEHEQIERAEQLSLEAHRYEVEAEAAGTVPGSVPAQETWSAAADEAAHAIAELLSQRTGGIVARLESGGADTAQTAFSRIAEDLSEGEITIEPSSGKAAGTAERTGAHVRISRPLSDNERSEIVKATRAGDDHARALGAAFGAELARREASERSLAMHHSLLLEDSRFGDPDSHEGERLRGAMMTTVLRKHLVSVPEQCALDSPHTSMHAWIATLALAPAAAIAGRDARGPALAQWRQGIAGEHARAIREIPLWEMISGQIERREDETPEAFENRFRTTTVRRIAQFVNETSIQTKALRTVHDYYRDCQELERVLDALEREPGCRVTLIDDTTEHCEHHDLERAFTGTGAVDSRCVRPPGTLYVSRQALIRPKKGETIQPGTKAIHRIEGALGLGATPYELGPLAKVVGGPGTNLQREAMAGLVSVPVIVGANLGASTEVPVVEVPEVGAGLMVALIAGRASATYASSGSGPWGEPIGEPTSRTLRALGLATFPHTTRYDVLVQLLEQPRTLAALLASRVASAACAITQLGPLKDGALTSAPNLKPHREPMTANELDAAVFEALNALGATYEAAQRKETLRIVRIRSTEHDDAGWEELRELRRESFRVANAAGVNVVAQENHALDTLVRRIATQT